MKRVLVFAVLLVLVMSMSVQAAGGVSAAVVPSARFVRAGQNVTATVQFTSPYTSVGSYTAELKYNPAVLAYVSHVGPPAGWMSVINPAPGKIRFVGAKVSGATGTFVPLVVTFRAKAGYSALDLEIVYMAEAGTFKNLLPVPARDSAVWAW